MPGSRVVLDCSYVAPSQTLASQANHVPTRKQLQARQRVVTVTQAAKGCLAHGLVRIVRDVLQLSKAEPEEGLRASH